MASTKIRGITIELGADTSGIAKALKNVDKDLRTTQKNLKDVDKLLKFNPGNTELLTQKQKGLESAIGLTKKRLDELKDAQSNVEKGSEQWDAIQREIIDTQNKLKDLEGQYRNFGSVAAQKVKAVGQSLQDAGAKVEAFGKKLAPVSTAAAAIGGSLLKMGYDAAQNADELNTLSKQTGISTDELQKMQYAADLVDVSVEDITGALRKLKGKIDPSNESLKALGVSVTNSRGQLRDATDVFYDSLTALSQIQNETLRDQVAMDLFGKSADSLAGIIDDGGKALRDYGQQAENLGLILDNDTLDSLNETNDAIDQMKAQISATMAVVGAKVVPVLMPIVEAAGELIANVAQKLSELNPETMKTILTITGIVAALAPAIIIGAKLISGIGTIITAVGSLIALLSNPLTLVILAAVAAITSLVFLGYQLYKNWDLLTAKAKELGDAISQSWVNLKNECARLFDEIKSGVQSLVNAFVTFGQTVKNVWETIKSFFSGDWQFPHIKLPHFYVTPKGWRAEQLLMGVIPSIGVQWYKKAYDNPVMFTSPTVIGTPGGMKGFGDGNGAEIVMGLDKLREMVGGMGGVTINVYASEGMNVNQLADKIQQKYVQAARSRRLLNA